MGIGHSGLVATGQRRWRIGPELTPGVVQVSGENAVRVAC